jgi:hypothetical protein
MGTSISPPQFGSASRRSGVSLRCSLRQLCTSAESSRRPEPSGKDEIVEHADQQGADENVMDLLRQISDGQYDGPNVVSHEISEAQ